MDRHLPAGGAAVRPGRSSCCSRARRVPPCGMADSAVGPFYLPGDKQVYLDTAFFQLMSDRFHGVGRFNARSSCHRARDRAPRPEAAGRLRPDRRPRGRAPSKTEVNRLSVQLELQADFYAGVWANHINKTKPGTLEPGDVEGPARGQRDQRRRLAETGPGVRRARLVHPRHLGPARLLVPQGAGDRRREAGGHDPVPVVSQGGSGSRLGRRRGGRGAAWPSPTDPSRSPPGRPRAARRGSRRWGPAAP